ncbi:hypothetical protein [Anaerorhabdus furcosa]|uniref:Uncharacterized protein n=1 Tax=Anaerorhabdus furcosa TaxID=118967 RepID=A0A1T4K968_9FIRM|nr:hypothetical protein [Anaerorhabdus furcosa]SJZ38992.1 hypothetical protein SAMN02745191_0412 [Anaerorhabdus furcosa]
MKKIISIICSFALILCFSNPSVFAEEHEKIVDTNYKRFVVMNTIPMNIDNSTSFQIEPRGVGAILVFLGGWLAGEIINGVFKAATGTTPSDIVASAITKAVNYALGKGKNMYGCSMNFDKNGNYISGSSGCGFGGTGGGGWRLFTL